MPKEVEIFVEDKIRNMKITVKSADLDKVWLTFAGVRSLVHISLTVKNVEELAKRLNEFLSWLKEKELG